MQELMDQIADTAQRLTNWLSKETNGDIRIAIGAVVTVAVAMNKSRGIPVEHLQQVCKALDEMMSEEAPKAPEPHTEGNVTDFTKYKLTHKGNGSIN